MLASLSPDAVALKAGKARLLNKLASLRSFGVLTVGKAPCEDLHVVLEYFNTMSVDLKPSVVSETNTIIEPRQGPDPFKSILIALRFCKASWGGQ